METNILRAGFAAEISGIDLSADLTDLQFTEIKGLWLENKIAIFCDQNLDDDVLIGFTKRFGPLFVHARSQFNDAVHLEIMLISNIKENGRNLGKLGNGDLAWHSD
jgi:taurine dioxygenase